MNFAINVNNGALSGNSQTNPQGDNEIINTAKSFLGTPYQWGGTSPSGFDCSGFVQYVLAQNGKLIKVNFKQVTWYSMIGVAEQKQPM